MAEKVASLITDDMRAWAIRLSREGGEMDRLARLKIARREGAFSAKLEDARNFLRMGLSKEQVAQGTGLSIEEIQDL